MDPATYLRRIDCDGECAASLETLRRLHRAHLLAVPFENLDIHLGRPIVLELPALFEKVATGHRGGFCYELNGLFAWLLRELGFEVELLSARVFGAGDEPGPEFDHLVLRVEAEGPQLVDVGFGDGFVEPLPLVEGEVVQRRYGYRLEREGEAWRLDRRGPDGDITPQYVFSPRPRALSDFEGMCRFHQSSPESHFTRRSLCSKLTERGRDTLSGDRLIVTEGEARHEQPVESGERYRAILRERFDVELDADADLTPLLRTR